MEKTDTPCGVIIHFSEAYSFRHLIELVSKMVKKSAFVFSYGKFELTFYTDDDTAIYKITIDGTELVEYTFNVNPPDMSPDDENYIALYPLSFDTNQLYTKISTIGKKDGLRIFWLVGDNKLNVQIIKDNSKDPEGASFVDIIEADAHAYDDVIFANKAPNIKVSAKEFCDQCKKITTQKCVNLEIMGYPDYMIVKGKTAQDQIAFVEKYISAIKKNGPIEKHGVKLIKAEDISKIKDLENGGSTGGPSGTDGSGVAGRPRIKVIRKSNHLSLINISEKTAKKFVKIKHIINSDHMIAFYFDNKDNPIKISFPVSNYGLCEIFQR